MNSEDIVRSWKDENYRMNLSDAEQALLPDDPAGLIELDDTELNEVGGGTDFLSYVMICAPSLARAICSCFGCPTLGPLFCYLD